MTPETITFQADHTLLLAVPALAPAIVVAGVVVYIAVRDRRRKDQTAETRDRAHSEGEDVASEDDSP
ncbi:hypothetical protein [Mycolicibacterium goodii]|uniref:hypothetical protein n=1 Tax=Mycolicibacterium goodii TaxID=134601 RepID=UPI000C26083D|nr:hypothetical protein [Mycolicibacterium goodii]MBU8807645.1 hypothetical protein [Mycolicibacterium goodii]MBU8815200.1 hypothetical protein [Mycolicibacterium goodii]MBU8828235.1 hypothetical protein [Mycolicibacterium goodii]PJK20005.1 hypothetical protein CSX11_23260 [Mycolicibacterium goodii]ULN47517.1 hypothetical protein MI170_30465 [Mycolicibacterium goodii]